MSHGPTYFATKGVCIYCGSRNVKLTNEHIVPYSLGGSHVIRDASCLSCADVTKKFEQRVARDMWGDARTSFNAPSRRKKQRRKFISMSDPDDLERNIDVPVDEYPAGLVFYKMGIPGRLQGLNEDVDTSNSWRFLMIDDDDRRKEFLKKNSGKLTIKFRHFPQEFGQLLCKIAYGQLLTVLDLEDFHPICLPYIMGDKTNVSHVVGGTLEDSQPNQDIGYSLNTSGIIEWKRKMLLIVNIRLYANTHAPGYQVVAGEVTGDQNIKRVLKKLGPLNLVPTET